MKNISYLLASGALFIAGCASIIDGGTQNISLASSSPDKVQATVVSISGVQSVRLPTVVTVKRSSQDIIVKVEEDDNPCYQGSEQTVPSNLNAWLFLNILLGGLVGTTTDAITGAMWAYDDQTIVQTTKKASCEDTKK